MVCMYSSNSAVVPVHIINMSSVNLFHVWMWFGARLGATNDCGDIQNCIQFSNVHVHV